MDTGKFIGPFFFEGKVDTDRERCTQRRLHRFGPNRDERFNGFCGYNIALSNTEGELSQIGRRCRCTEVNRAVDWSPKSPDLTPWDFFVGIPQVHANLGNLEQIIRNKTDNLRHNMQMVPVQCSACLGEPKFAWKETVDNWKTNVTNKKVELALFLCLKAELNWILCSLFHDISHANINDAFSQLRAVECIRQL